jgi:hypothetical protein
MSDFQYHDVPADCLEAFLTLTNIDESTDLLADFNSNQSSFFELAGPLIEHLQNPGVTQEFSYFFGQTPGYLPSTEPIASQFSSRMGWCAALTVQQKLAPHLRGVFDEPDSYDPGEASRALRTTFQALTPRLVGGFFSQPYACFFNILTFL